MGQTGWLKRLLAPKVCLFTNDVWARGNGAGQRGSAAQDGSGSFRTLPLVQKILSKYHSSMKAVGFVVLTSNDSHLTWPKVMGLSRRSREARLKLETTHWIFSRKVIPSTIYMFISCCIHLTTRFVDHRKILLTWSQVNDLIQRILFVSNSQCIPLLVQWHTW
jgi:hypothetical protein